jgi:hypothetical protein
MQVYIISNDYLERNDAGINAEQPIFKSILSGFEVFDNIDVDRTGTVLFVTKVENLPPEICLLTIGVIFRIRDSERSC